MSIPPLVCSTPPPPDQCEEEKNPEDFDIQYNLSQDEDDDGNDYGYGGFSSYSHMQSPVSSHKNIDVANNGMEYSSEYTNENIKTYEENKSEEYIQNVEVIDDLAESNTTNENNLKCDDDIIEDLNLKMGEVSINTFVQDSTEEVLIDKPDNGDNTSIKEADIPILPDSCIEEHDKTVFTNSVDATTESPSEQKNELLIENEIIEDTNNIIIPEPDIPSSDINLKSDTFLSTVDKIRDVEKVLVEDDDFGDFDDFQYSNPQESKPVIDNIFSNCDNPWDNNESADDSDFGNFEASFEPNLNQNITSLDLPNISENSKPDAEIMQQNVEEDDDFGEFDDFKSSTIENETFKTPEETISCPDMLNLQSSENEHQTLDRINKVIQSIFEEDISAPETEFESKLESFLSVTWGHLMETDERQPYMVNWNNSLGQKTLLKALCIDSRNILFGPKWSCNMPKYAANLGNTPLQPQKPLTPSNLPQSETSSLDKSAKLDNWTDPFTVAGQESCDTESTSAQQDSSANLDGFEAAISSKSDKIYSSTLNVQPLRQISLPDTHIFTPIDSETPRSKTIHYDSGPSVLLPQPIIDDQKENIPVQNELQGDNEYWEFQDFKGSTNPVTDIQGAVQQQETVEIKPVAKSNITYQTQVLQPIKMEPILPTLNWPDPGEVKETFEDFSDFVSNSGWNDQQDTIQTASSDIDKINSVIENDVFGNVTKNIDIKDTLDITKLSNNEVEDDFDTFKSALPIHTPEINPNNHTVSSGQIMPTKTVPPLISNQILELNNALPKINNDQSDDIISISNLPKPNDAKTPSYIMNTPMVTIKNELGPQMQNNIMQPTSASSSTTQRSGQILQPLSLEGYSQINWPSPGIDLQDLSRFNPVETLKSLKSDLTVSGHSKVSSPIHSQKVAGTSQITDDDLWGEFVSSKPKQQTVLPKKPPSFVDDDEWTDFVSSPSVKPQNGLNTISLNVHTNSNMQKTNQSKLSIKKNQVPLEIPSLNYITPKASGNKSYNDRHFQNL